MFFTLPIVSIIGFFLPIQINGFSNESMTNPILWHLPITTDRQTAILYTTSGYSNLLAVKYESALEDFQKASKLLGDFNRWEDRDSSNSLRFLIYYGIVISCDNLGFQDDLEKNVFLIQNLIQESYDDGSFSYSGDVPVESADAAQDLMELAFISPSTNTQTFLLNAISELFPYSANFQSGLIQATPAKSFLKKLERFARKVKKEWNEILELLERTKDLLDGFSNAIKDDLNKSKKPEA